LTEITRQVVATIAPARLDAYDELTAAPLLASGALYPWTPEMRSTLLLLLWSDFDPDIPN
jgi:hypothetical protein